MSHGLPVNPWSSRQASSPEPSSNGAVFSGSIRWGRTGARDASRLATDGRSELCTGMADNPPKPSEIQLQIQLDDDIANGQYINMALVNHTETEFTLDFIYV